MVRVSLSWALILGLLAGIGPMCTDLYLPALPEMSEQLAATTTVTQLTLTASLIGLGVGQLLFGPLSDKIGRKRPLILSLLLFIVSSILCATTNNIYWLVVWRFIQGIAGAGGSVLSRSIAQISGSNVDPVFCAVNDGEWPGTGVVASAGRVHC